MSMKSKWLAERALRRELQEALERQLPWSGSADNRIRALIARCVEHDAAESKEEK